MNLKYTTIFVEADSALEKGYLSYLRKIISQSPDLDRPLMLIDVNMALAQARKWAKHLPDVQPYFAVKCNPDPALICTLNSAGVRFDVASAAEMDLVESLQCGVSSCIYANPCKAISGIKHAARLGVSKMVFDNYDELLKIKTHFPCADLFMRLQTDDSASRCPMSAKYGCPVSMWKSLLSEAIRLKLRLVGMAFHVGSACQQLGAFTKAIRLARDLFDCAKNMGVIFEYLDIGGGFPGRLPSLEFMDAVKFDDIAAEIRAAVYEFFPVSQYPDLQLIAEPGRFFAAPSCTLAVQIQSKRVPINPVKCIEIDEIKNEDKFLYYINDGIYGSFNCITFDHASPTLTPLNTSHIDRKYASTIFGPTCDGIDCVDACAYLPEMNVGDWLVAKEMGAYTTCASSSFNGFPKPLMLYCRFVKEYCC